MKPSTYDFRQFQEDLAALDRKGDTPAPSKEKPASKKESAQDRMAQAKAEFTALRERYGLPVADVAVFFPEEEGITYLQGLIAAQQAKPRRRSRKSEPPNPQPAS